MAFHRSCIPSSKALSSIQQYFTMECCLSCKALETTHIVKKQAGKITEIANCFTALALL